MPAEACLCHRGDSCSPGNGPGQLAGPTELPSCDGGFRVTLHSFGRSVCQYAFDFKPMKRLAVILALAVLLGSGAYFVSYGVARCTFCRMPDTRDSSSWLRQEFHLSDSQYAQVKKLEADYHPHCVDLCD